MIQRTNLGLGIVASVVALIALLLVQQAYGFAPIAVANLCRACRSTLEQGVGVIVAGPSQLGPPARLAGEGQGILKVGHGIFEPS